MGIINDWPTPQEQSNSKTKDNNSDDNSLGKSPEEEKERDEYQLEVIENQCAEKEFMREHVTEKLVDLQNNNIAKSISKNNEGDVN